jgi:ketosteroid isomerase-like protein
MPVDTATVAAWLDAYVAAWKSYDPEAIGALFTDDVKYRFHPYDDPVEGREAVVESWLGKGEHEGAPGRDEEGTYNASYRPIAVDGDVAVASGSSTYTRGPCGPIDEIYDNCFVMRFDADGRCREFTEWFVKRPGA